jgi:hypothetical protein
MINARKTFLALGFAAAGGLALAGGVAPVLAPAPAWAETIVVAPPTLKVEVIPAAPTHKPRDWFVWDPGHWAWAGGKYDWVPGHWIERPRLKAVWVPGHWDHRGREHVWAEGHWR